MEAGYSLGVLYFLIADDPSAYPLLCVGPTGADKPVLKRLPDCFSMLFVCPMAQMLVDYLLLSLFIGGWTTAPRTKKRGCGGQKELFRWLLNGLRGERWPIEVRIEEAEVETSSRRPSGSRRESWAPESMRTSITPSPDTHYTLCYSPTLQVTHCL